MAAVALTVAIPSSMQNGLPAEIPSADDWVDIRTLAPAVTDAATRAQMNQEIVQAITEANGDQARARAAILAIAARYQQAAQSQSARVRPGPK